MRPFSSDSIADLAGVSRRTFFRMAAGAAAATTLPIVTEAHLALAQRVRPRTAPPPGAVMIDANENPLGPCSGACSTISGLIPQGGRYSFNLTEDFVKTFAEIEGVKPENVMPYAGSSEPLHYTVLAFTSKDKSYVTADPGYEAGMYAATVNGAPVKKVPLTSTHTHDVRAMVSADPNAGVIYICNPNNPTGTITSRSDIEYALANKPKDAILLIDEAYIHFSDATPSMDLVSAGKDVIVLRTFSKIYGMAGMRCGVAVARPDLLEKLKAYGMNSLPIMAVGAATSSMKQSDLIAQRRKINTDIREDTFAWLTANNYSFIPSQSNCFMMDTKRPGKDVIAAMAKKNVFIGRTWPIWPNYVRITVGSRSDMDAFKKAYKEVMSSDVKQVAAAHAAQVLAEYDRTLYSA